MVPKVTLSVEIWWEIGGKLAQIRAKQYFHATQIPNRVNKQYGAISKAWQEKFEQLMCLLAIHSNNADSLQEKVNERFV